MSGSSNTSVIIKHNGISFICSFTVGYHPIVCHVLNRFGISNEYKLYQGDALMDSESPLKPGEYHTKKIDDATTDIITVTNQAFECRCGSKQWSFQGFEDHYHGPITNATKATFLHVKCCVCKRLHGLLGEPGKDWIIQ